MNLDTDDTVSDKVFRRQSLGTIDKQTGFHMEEDVYLGL